MANRRLGCRLGGSGPGFWLHCGSRPGGRRLGGHEGRAFLRGFLPAGRHGGIFSGDQLGGSLRGLGPPAMLSHRLVGPGLHVVAVLVEGTVARIIGSGGGDLASPTAARQQGGNRQGRRNEIQGGAGGK